MSNRPVVAVVGSANADLVVQVDRLPHRGETIQGSDLAMFPGGKGANQAAAAARSGGEVWFCGCLGADGSGELLQSSLVAAGVRIDGVQIVSRPTGTALILLSPDGENSIVVSPGANHAISVEVADEMSEFWLGADVVVLNLEIPFDTVRHVIRQASAAGVRVLLNAAPARPLPADLLRDCDPLVVNQHEARIVLDDPTIPADATFEVLADALLTAGAKSAVITLGSTGSILADAAGQLIQPAYRVDTVDTTGAGDAFVGAVAAELAAGRTLREAVGYATAMSAVSVQRMGAQSSYADRQDVLDFMASHSPRA